MQARNLRVVGRKIVIVLLLRSDSLSACVTCFAQLYTLFTCFLAPVLLTVVVLFSSAWL